MEAIIIDQAVDYKTNLEQSQQRWRTKDSWEISEVKLMINIKSKEEGKVETIQISSLSH